MKKIVSIILVLLIFFSMFSFSWCETTIATNSNVKIVNVIVPEAIRGDKAYAIDEHGGLWSWGDNKEGTIGDGTNISKDKPVKIMSNVVSVASDGKSSFAIKKDGSLWSWGSNWSGILGSGDKISSNSPKKVIGISDIRYVTVTNGTVLAIKADGTLWAWGENVHKLLGIVATGYVCTPYQINGISDVVDVCRTTFGEYFAIKNDGTVWAWGQYGRVNIPTMIPEVTTNNTCFIISANLGNVAVLKTDGTIWSDSSIDSGKYISDIATFASDGQYSIAIKSNGTLWEWGYSHYAQTTPPYNIGQNTPTMIEGINGAKSIYLSEIKRNYVINNDDELIAWGHCCTLPEGHDFREYYYAPPKEILKGVKSVHLAPGGGRAYALKKDGTLWRWGHVIPEGDIPPPASLYSINGSCGWHDIPEQVLFIDYSIPIQTPTPSIKVGDLSGDQKINSIDYSLMIRYILGIIDDFPIENDIYVADINSDGKINSIDYTLLRKYILGTI